MNAVEQASHRSASQVRYASEETEARTHKFPIDLEVAKPEKGLDVSVLEGDEPKAFASARLAVQHNRSIDDLAELRKVLSHRLRRDTAS